MGRFLLASFSALAWISSRTSIVTTREDRARSRQSTTTRWHQNSPKWAASIAVIESEKVDDHRVKAEIQLLPHDERKSRNPRRRKNTGDSRRGLNCKIHNSQFQNRIEHSQRVELTIDSNTSNVIRIAGGTQKDKSTLYRVAGLYIGQQQ
mmetsp:Transcript_7611/g.18645  ORF Transcript_7611/g.18645 Transcript_7611/m.18645 type:complete len:150 (-) Transcript_7611:179-628(-)